jgi:hypothetical protein
MDITPVMLAKIVPTVLATAVSVEAVVVAEAIVKVPSALPVVLAPMARLTVILMPNVSTI